MKDSFRGPVIDPTNKGGVSITPKPEAPVHPFAPKPSAPQTPSQSPAPSSSSDLSSTEGDSNINE